MNLTQTVISPDYQSLMICKKFPNSTGIISTFQRNGSSFESHLIIPKNRHHRVQRIYNMVPEVCSYKTYNDSIMADCILPISENLDIFNDRTYLKTGLLHYDLVVETVQEEDKQACVCDINPRLLIHNYDNIETEQCDIVIKPLVIDKIKIFTIVMVRGFMTCVATTSRVILQMIICKPSENFVGICPDMDDQRKMLGNIKLMWPIFKTENVKHSIKLYLKSKTFQLSNRKNHPIFIQLSRKLNDNKTQIDYIGESVYIK